MEGTKTSSASGNNRILVPISRYEIGNSSTVLTGIAIGSCVAAVLFDSEARIGGLAHILLPDSRQGDSRKSHPAGKFADTAIPALIKEMRLKGAEVSRIKAKLVGGAQMFNLVNKPDGDQIGNRNVEAARNVLKSKKIKIVGEDIGGTRARTIDFEPATGCVKVYIAGQGKPGKVL